MKTYFKFLVLTLFVFQFTSSATVHFVNKYKKTRGCFKMLTVPMSFDSDSILRKLPKFDASRIIRIDYVATSYNKKITDYQRYLNKKRWNTLSDILSLPKNIDYDKKEFYQTGAKNKTEAETYFHGYIIYYGHDSKRVHAHSLVVFPKLINTITENKIYSNSNFIIPKSKQIDSVYLGEISKQKKSDYDRMLVKNNHILEWGYDSIGVNKNIYGAYYILTKVSAGLFLAYNSLRDKSVFSMLLRARLTKNTLIVTDLTGSMYPYYSQVLVWQALKLSQGKNFKHAFFNDGNQKNTQAKVIGKTGGVYLCASSNIVRIYNTMQKTMSSGGGGDTPENNMEAVLKGINQYKNIDNIIMVADNFAFPRDKKLIHKIQRPIQYVMCGTQLGISRSYINLSRHYGGSIISVEKSICYLNQFKDGDEFTIEKVKYSVNKGKMVRLN